jgi:hypothetical protein
LRSGEKRLDPRQHIQVGHSDLPLEAAGEAAITTVINDPVAVATATLIFQAPDQAIGHAYRVRKAKRGTGWMPLRAVASFPGRLAAPSFEHHLGAFQLGGQYLLGR